MADLYTFQITTPIDAPLVTNAIRNLANVGSVTRTEIRNGVGDYTQQIAVDILSNDINVIVATRNAINDTLANWDNRANNPAMAQRYDATAYTIFIVSQMAGQNWFQFMDIAMLSSPEAIAENRFQHVMVQTLTMLYLLIDNGLLPWEIINKDGSLITDKFIEPIQKLQLWLAENPQFAPPA